MLQVKTNITAQKLDGETSMIKIQGDLNSYAEYPLFKAYEEASRNGATLIILDLSGLDYMNSYGIGLLVALLMRVRARNQRLTCYGLKEHYLRIFSLTRLSDAIPVRSNQAQAIAAGNA